MLSPELVLEKVKRYGKSPSTTLTNDLELTYSHIAKVGATAVGSAVLIPAVGVAALGAMGFTAGGVAAG